ncbi:MAG TPA: nitrile hydratase subunit alpha [Stellaceae bacterium]|jgi:nitrile hydratase|nr:nitrile hydratase subunit alpha [Stellaceae bacterium]
MAHEHEHGHDHDHHDHGHDHEHAHPGVQADDETAPSDYELRMLAISELLVEKGVISRDQIRRSLERLDSWQPSRGAEIVARAWLEPEFKARLLANGSEAIKDFGIDMGETVLTVVENTPGVQNVIVCTLCSCYPRAVLGLPPDWYRSKSYRSRVVKEPRQVLAEFGTVLPDDVAVRVHDSLADLRYLVLPQRPPETAGWNAEQLAAIVTRDCMVGVINPDPRSRAH